MAALDPGLRDVAGISLLYSGEPYSCTVPARYETLSVWAERLISRNPTKILIRTNAKKPQNPRGTFESTKHDRYPPILLNMRDGLYSCSGVWVQYERIVHTRYTLPLPVRSSYQTCFELTKWKQSDVPLGDRLTWPCALRGAVATQNKRCFLIHSKSD